MKVNATSRAGVASGAKGAQRMGGAFSLGAYGGASEAAPARPATGITGVASVDALLALQAVGDPTERRRRAVGRASRILDVLDEVKIALLEGEVTPAALDQLMSVVRDEREGTEDPRLESVLDEIEVRAAVELAKHGRASAM